MPANGRSTSLKWDMAAGAVALLVLALAIGWRQRQAPSPPPARPAAQPITVEIVRPPQPVPKPQPAESPAAPTPSPRPAVDPGAMPPLVANYREHVGFRRYAEGMQRAGAAFYIIGGNPRQFLRIDLTDGLVPTTLDTIRTAGYSPRTRAITDEPALAPWLDRARTEHGIADPVVVMLVPQTFEQRLADAIAAAVRAAGIPPEQVVAVRGEYRLDDGRLALSLNEARQTWGSRPISGELRL